MGKIILGLLVGSLAFGQYAPPITLPGSTYVWNGVSLTGVSTGATAVTTVASGNSSTLHTAPANKRSLVFANILNPTATTSTYALNKVNGVNSCAIFPPGATTGPSQGNVSLASTVLEPGESLQVVVSVAGSMEIVGNWIDFDSTVPLKSPTIYAGFATGTTTVYTTPATATALLFPRNGLTGPPGVNNTAAVVIADASVATSLGINIGGTQWYPSTSIGGAAGATQYGLPGFLPASTAVAITSSGTGLTTACFIMPTLWERPN